MLIIIDGIDGSGKSTQTKILVRRLKAEKYPVETLNFPQYHQFFGQMVKRFLTGEFGQIDNVDPHLASVLYAMDRWQARDKINQWLKENTIVILNRYTTSNLIHQTIKLPQGKHQKFINWIEQMEYHILGLPKPEIIIYLYLPACFAYALITKRGGKKDIHEANMRHLKLASKYGLRLAQTKQNWRLIRCNRGKEILTRNEIAEKIWRIVKSKIKIENDQIPNPKSEKIPNVQSPIF